MTGHLPIRDRWRIISLYFDQNVLPSQIAVINDCSVPTVLGILRLYDETDDVTEREGRGRPPLSDTDRTEFPMCFITIELRRSYGVTAIAL